MFFIEKGNLPKIKIIIFMAETTCTIYQRMANIKRKIKTINLIKKMILGINNKMRVIMVNGQWSTQLSFSF